jgi:hypothetical protein
MNTDTTLNSEPEDNFKSFQKFVRKYCAANGRTEHDVMQDSILVELLNIQWLRTKSGEDEGAKCDRTK